MRLATLATFWNVAEPSERLVILRHLISLISRKPVDSAYVLTTMQKYDEDKMQALPMKNYQDLEIPEAWCKWFASTTASDKAELVVNVWKSCDEKEQGLIVKDMQVFFGGAA